MGFKINSSKASEGFTLKPEGDYEVIIESAEVKTFPSGSIAIAFQYVIRNDVDQKFQNGKIFHNVWKKKEPNEDDLAVDGFNYGQLMAISDAAALPDGQEYGSLAEFLTALSGKPVKVHLYHDDYNDKYYEKIDLHMKTGFPQVKHKPKASANSTGYAVPAAAQYSNADIAKAGKVDDKYPF